MNIKGKTTRMRTVAAALAVTVFAGTLAACGGSSGADDQGSKPGASEGVTDAEMQAALEKGGDLTWWTWVGWSETQAKAFSEKYPNVNIEVVNVGTGGEEYTQIENALQAGSGAPDIAQIEYFAIPQFALSEGLLDLKQFGFDGLQDKFTASTWAQSSINGGVYGLPQDSGPIVMMYNAELFETHNVAVPTTWDEYIAAAETLKKADSKIYMNNEVGGPVSLPLVWAFGGNPFQIEGNNISINTLDEGSTNWAETWNKLVELDAVSDIATWSTDWWTALGNDSIATVLSGAWMPGIFENSLPDSAGKWRVAPLPTMDGTPLTGENGGSSMAITSQTKNPVLAAAFLKWLTTDQESVDLFLESGGFPATTADLGNQEFADKEWDFYGGQKVNQVSIEASNSVSTEWSFLPYQIYAYTIFGDTVGQSFVNRSDFKEGLAAWQESLVTFGNQQGFTVNK
ncbi:sugar ABC transporter substrate-binding protein [Timonella senegalensis]|uniref:ABC transporter substrate-binding protein n=1 Tax=Timonella senegalensis TaxID=1465825 RepID=UPI002FDE04AF